ncbi:porphobilinogen deaminase, dipyromethane cofactor binding domain-containing protein [Bombardia bombarda]|uniref:Porphobilinogen deaminase n=1 Tax=Bombardia bombarda TaxID=252184 RepID=A0AA39XKS2_9PEZI|nr:porphobilinogen deaminase, dipyromethane cofactor binding domain-containing protein [Bombardia bombarda]
MSSEPYTVVRIGTRRSALALKQVELIIASLSAHHPSIRFETHAMATAGDRDKVNPLSEMGKGLWTNDLEAKLLAREVDMIVHCLKDMPTAMPAGCRLTAVTAREDPRDVVVFSAFHQGRYKTLADLPEGSVVGTSSVRRAAQLRRAYAGLRFKDVRGNIHTRLRKANRYEDPANGFDCIILAAAGLHRLDMAARIAQYLDSSTEGGGLLHAVGQGALGLEIREGDEEMAKVLECIRDEKTMLACEAERSVMRTLEGGCSVPIGVETSWVGEKKLRIKMTVVSLDGKEVVDGEKTGEVGSLEEGDRLGRELALELAEKGAQRILDVINVGRDKVVKVADL